jgi:hypothetical protein
MENDLPNDNSVIPESVLARRIVINDLCSVEQPERICLVLCIEKAACKKGSDPECQVTFLIERKRPCAYIHIQPYLQEFDRRTRKNGLRIRAVHLTVRECAAYQER